MTNLVDDLANVCAALESLGEHHKELGLTIETPMWAVFQRVFEDNPPKSVHQNADGHAAWKLMVAFIVRQTRFGYEKALRKSESQSFDSNSD
uniref:Globin family profile domain-containing protein n=1 Tax=Panagrolaimus sp. JU765 TaxID=591449 RepID=A0AC34QHL6_9BILA